MKSKIDLKSKIVLNKLSPWFDVKERPVRNGRYEILDWNDEERFLEFTDNWEIPEPYIKCWRGICG